MRDTEERTACRQLFNWVQKEVVTDKVYGLGEKEVAMSGDGDGVYTAGRGHDCQGCCFSGMGKLVKGKKRDNVRVGAWVSTF